MKVKVSIDTKWNKWIRDNQKSNNSKNFFSTQTLNSIFNIQFYDDIIMQVIVSNFYLISKNIFPPYFTEIEMSICKDENDNAFG